MPRQPSFSRGLSSPPGTPLAMTIEPRTPAVPHTPRPPLPTMPTPTMHVKRITLTSKKNWWMGKQRSHFWLSAAHEAPQLRWMRKRTGTRLCPRLSPHLRILSSPIANITLKTTTRATSRTAHTVILMLKCERSPHPLHHPYTTPRGILPPFSHFPPQLHTPPLQIQPPRLHHALRAQHPSFSSAL